MVRPRNRFAIYGAVCDKSTVINKNKTLDNYIVKVYNSKAIRGVAQFGSFIAEARPVDDEARREWRSGQNS